MAASHALIRCALIVCAVFSAAQIAEAQLQSVPAVHGDLSRSLLGDGTGVIIGSVDSGIDSTHPALAGNDSLGNPRLVVQQNFVTSEPTNTGDDVFGHGTWTASIMLSSDPTFTGFAPDARFVNARVLDSTNSFGNNSIVLNGIGFDISHGAQVINLSLNYFIAQNTGTDAIERMIDWASENMNVNFTVSAGNISTGDGTTQVRGPGSAYNSLTVGRTTVTFDQVHFDSSIGPTGDGRANPMLWRQAHGLSWPMPTGKAVRYGIQLRTMARAFPRGGGRIDGPGNRLRPGAWLQHQPASD